jgi:hypothetical protein
MINNTISFTINVIAFAHGLFGCINSTFIFTIIIYHLYHNRIKREHKVAFILCANIYSLIFIYSATLVSFDIHTLLGDLYDLNFDSSWCTFTGYFVSVMLAALYYSFVIQVSHKLYELSIAQYQCSFV